MVEESVWLLRLRAAKIPFIILSAFFLLSLLAGLFSFSLYESIFMNSWLSFVITIAAFIIGAYIALIDFEIPLKRVVGGGFFAGLGIGIVATVVAIILLHNSPLLETQTNLALEKMAEAGAPPIGVETLEQNILVFSYVGFVTNPLIYGGIGALLAWLGALLAQWFEKKFSGEESGKKSKDKKLKNK